MRKLEPEDAANRAFEALLHRVGHWESGEHRPVRASVLKSSGKLRPQNLHSDHDPDKLHDDHPQHSAMVALAENTHVMLADGSAVVFHR